MKERLSYFDVCKGLLITLLMFSHLTWISRDFHGINNNVINTLHDYSSIWNCFFMSCFFFITGMCSNFKKKTRIFFISNFKSLVVPAIISLIILNIPKVISLDYQFFLEYIFLFGGALWFLSALFLSKIVLFVLNKWIKKEWLVLSILVLMSFLGKVLDEMDLFPNFWYHRNFLNFTLFLGIGYYFKDYILRKIAGVIGTVLFFITILVLWLLNIHIPNIASSFNESLSQHPLSIWLSITGSITSIHLCKIINTNSILEFLGKNSLVIYIYHMLFLSKCVIVLTSTLNSGISYLDSIFLIVMTVTTTLFLCSVLAAIIDTKYLRWIKGAF